MNKTCTTGNCSTMGKVLGVIRILLGIAMIYFGITKFGASPEKIAAIGGAGHAMGLDFLSTTVWFWIAVVSEILAGLMILSGCKKCARVGAVIALIIILFAVNAMGWNPNAIAVSIAALVVVVLGPGARCFCKAPCCKGGSCDKNSGSTAGGIAAGLGGMASGVAGGLGDIAGKATDLAGDAVGSVTNVAGDIAGKAKDIAGDAVEGAGGLAGGVTDMAQGAIGSVTDAAGDVAGSVADKAKGIVETVGDKIDDATGGTVSGVVDQVQEVAGDIIDKAVDVVEDLAEDAGDTVKDMVDGDDK